MPFLTQPSGVGIRPKPAISTPRPLRRAETIWIHCAEISTDKII